MRRMRRRNSTAKNLLNQLIFTGVVNRLNPDNRNTQHRRQLLRINNDPFGVGIPVQIQRNNQRNTQLN